MTTVYEQVQNACWRLNAEAYEQQVLAKGKRLKQFYPCEKAEALMAAIRTDEHLGTAQSIADYTQCACHNDLPPDELMAYRFDDTYRIAADDHDYKTLYPKLYGGE